MISDGIVYFMFLAKALETLIEYSNMFNYKDKHFYLFAKTGFTKGCIEKAAEMGNVTPIGFNEMI